MSLLASVAVLSPAIAVTLDRASIDLSNVKQLSTAVILYSSDSDDILPLALAQKQKGGYRSEARFTTNPSDYMDGEYNWATAIYPYCKSVALYSSVGAPRHVVEGKPNDSLPGVGHSYNGLLNAFNAALVETPSETVMFTQSFGFVNLEGWAVSNPEITCVANQPCVYKPSERNCGGTEPGTTSRLKALNVPQYGSETLSTGEKDAKVQVVARADGSARPLRFDKAASTAPYPAAEFFWSRLDGEGKPTAVWTDAHGCHPLRFRPDYKREDGASAREMPR